MTRPHRLRRSANLIVAIVLLALVGGCSRGASGPAATLLDPAAFERRMTEPAATVINVHVPYEGELEGTDAFIPYLEIVGDTRLPAAHNAEILLYCRSGRMSRIAGDALAAYGYTNLYDLDGGMDAWQESGRALLHRPEPT
jgi:rhodanese-related sulfurtransferase